MSRALPSIVLLMSDAERKTNQNFASVIRFIFLSKCFLYFLCERRMNPFVLSNEHKHGIKN